ncbi:metal ABC transporter solute-binding protein, Zn/Mn family [Spiribacter pallidus]|uniref:Zinc ABC transporter substrate-binding protein n=1 Tax=Spiribacter pallidus TaxID=1987936 RepID=A0ABV3TB98_9GAMM
MPKSRIRRAAMAVVIALAPGPVLAAPLVVATTGMAGDLVATIGGDCIDAEVLMGPGVDPHLYQATASDVRAFQKAELIVYNGFGLEGQLADVLAGLDRHKATLAVAEAAARAGPIEALDGEAGYATDPHLWMQPALWSQAVPAVEAALARLAPDCLEPMQRRAAAYRQQLQALDRWMAASLATIPSGQRVLLTAHDAFGYLSQGYGLEVRGVQGISTQAEPSVAAIQSVADLIAQRNIPAVFIETTINPRTVEAVIEAARARGTDVEVGGSLYGDALGQPGTLADTLVGMLIHNTRVMTDALGGQVIPLPEALAPWQQRREEVAP